MFVNSRSEMRRLAMQNPDALIREIEKLRNENEVILSLLRRLREQFYNWDQQADEKKEAALAVDDFFLSEAKQ